MNASDEALMMTEFTKLADQFHGEVTLAAGNRDAYEAAARRFKSAVVEMSKRFFPDSHFWTHALDALLLIWSEPEPMQRRLFADIAKAFEQTRK